MPKLKMFSALDKKLGTWSPPMFFQHVGQAERVWADIANDPSGNGMVSKHPEDFDLYHVGEFDDSNASLSSTQPIHIMSALAAKIKPQPTLPFDQPRK